MSARAARPAIPRPVPRPTPVTQPFWDAAAREQLLIQRCAAPRCGTPIFYPKENCPACGGTDLAWEAASGAGTVYSFTIARRPTHPGLADRVPYVIAIVELAEGPRLTTNIVGCDPDDVRIGMPVEVCFEDAGETKLPMFRPAGARATG